MNCQEDRLTFHDNSICIPAHGLPFRAAEARRRAVYPESEPKQRRPKVLVGRHRRHSRDHRCQRRRRGRPQRRRLFRGQREAQAVFSVFLPDSDHRHHQRGALHHLGRHAHQGGLEEGPFSLAICLCFVSFSLLFQKCPNMTSHFNLNCKGTFIATFQYFANHGVFLDAAAAPVHPAQSGRADQVGGQVQ